MDIASIIVGAIGVGIPAFFTYLGIRAQSRAQIEATKAEAEKSMRAEAQKWALEHQRVLSEAKATDIAALKGMVATATEYAQESQRRVNELETEADADRARIREMEDAVATERRERCKLEKALAAVRAELDKVKKEFEILCAWLVKEGRDPAAIIEAGLAQAQGG